MEDKRGVWELLGEPPLAKKKFLKRWEARKDG